MDLSAFIQENKRWLLGCLLGLVVFFVARRVVESMYDPGPDRARAQSLAASLPAEIFDSATLQQVEQEARALSAAGQRLRAELVFEQAQTYLLEGQSMSPDQYLGKVGRDLKLRIQRAANERDVEIGQRRGLSWPAVTNVDQIRAVMFGLELLDEAAQRLFAAHDAVRQADPAAMGLVSMSLVVPDKPASRSVRRRRDEFDPAEIVRTQQVEFEIEADEQTAMRFLEALRRPNRTLTLVGDGFLWTKPQHRGDPTKIKGRLEGVTFPEGQ